MKVMDTTAFPFLNEMHRQIDGRATAPTQVLDAVALLTAAADPARADRLSPRPGEPAALVERLAVWALRRVDRDTVADARLVLDGAPVFSPASTALAA